MKAEFLYHISEVYHPLALNEEITLRKSGTVLQTINRDYWLSKSFLAKIRGIESFASLVKKGNLIKVKQVMEKFMQISRQ